MATLMSGKMEPMSHNEAKVQTDGMAAFIINEAKRKAKEFEENGNKEFSEQVRNIKAEETSKIIKEYEKKAKLQETKYKIKKSMTINKQRLEKIKARQEMMTKISEDASVDLAKEVQNSSAIGALTTKLIVQCMLKLLEDEVTVRCRASDVAMVKGCIAAAEAEYTKVIKEDTGANKKCKLLVDTANPLSPDIMGGVILSCERGMINVDNTLDTRLKLVMEQDKPAIRGLLFPVT